jgi:hypothetical protein
MSHSSIEIPAANTAIARYSAGFRSVHEILFMRAPETASVYSLNYCLITTPTLYVRHDLIDLIVRKPRIWHRFGRAHVAMVRAKEFPQRLFRH